MNIGDTVKTLLGEMQKIARSESVVGEPIRAGETTVVPVSHVSIGFGVGGGELNGELPTSRESKGQVGGGGTGGGISIDPVAFIVIPADGHAKLLHLKGGTRQITRVIDLVPEVIDRILAKRSESSTQEDDESTETEK